MNREQFEALCAVIDYLWEDEAEHYEECDEKGKASHIFNSLKTLEEFRKSKQEEFKEIPLDEGDTDEIAEQVKAGNTSGIIDNDGFRTTWKLETDKFPY